jgi:hypothetical protein
LFIAAKISFIEPLKRSGKISQFVPNFSRWQACSQLEEKRL